NIILMMKIQCLITKLYHTALSGVMRYTTGGQDAHPTRVLLLKFVPHSNGICCIWKAELY
ncbi:MAG: hypothetical protein ACKPGJ_14580, partial [Dolichospermum sp.]